MLFTSWSPSSCPSQLRRWPAAVCTGHSGHWSGQCWPVSFRVEGRQTRRHIPCCIWLSKFSPDSEWSVCWNGSGNRRPEKTHKKIWSEQFVFIRTLCTILFTICLLVRICFFGEGGQDSGWNLSKFLLFFVKKFNDFCGRKADVFKWIFEKEILILWIFPSKNKFWVNILTTLARECQQTPPEKIYAFLGKKLKILTKKILLRKISDLNDIPIIFPKIFIIEGETKDVTRGRGNSLPSEGGTKKRKMVLSRQKWAQIFALPMPGYK